MYLKKEQVIKVTGKRLEYRSTGRTEIIGNHTDHQSGCVIAAAIDRYVTAEVIPGEDGRVTLAQDGFREISFDLSDTQIREEEKGTSASLARGVVAYLKDHGFNLHGFKARVTSQVPPGSGISSSAAYEVLLGRILTDLSDQGSADPVTLALAGLFAEKEYYGKPSGMMDQMAIANGGFTYMDFGTSDPEQPEIESLDFNPEDYGYKLCLVRTGGSHADLTHEYAAIPYEMGRVAAYFGERVLRAVKPEDFYAAVPALRSQAGDRAVLRAAHYFDENKRVQELRAAIKHKDMDQYLKIIRASGHSSYELLQNICPADAVSDQSMAVALMVSNRILNGAGASRVHGGGFAGTIQSYVPSDLISDYRKEMEKVFGEGACQFVSITY